MLAKVIVTLLVTAVSGHNTWIHPMHSVYDEYPDEGQFTPAAAHQGRFLSLSRDQLIRIKRMLRGLPYRNALLDVIRNAAAEAERGRDVDLSLEDILPDPEDRLLEMWQFDTNFQRMAVEYMSTADTQSKIQLLPNANDVPDPEDRNQTQGDLGCFADFHAYVGPLTRRWLWDVLTLNNVSTGSLDRPDAPERKYYFILDAIGRRPTGLYEGQFHWLGSYEECTTQVVHHVVRVGPGLLDPPENRTFRGKYARLDMPISLDKFGSNDTLPYSLGTCVPDTCTKEEVFWYIMHNNSILSALMWGIEDVYMGQETDWATDKPAKAAFGILLAGAIIILFATCYDGWGRHRIIKKNIKKHGNVNNNELTMDDLKKAKRYLYEKPGILDKLEVAFASYSLYTNLRNIFTTRPRYKGCHIPALDGIRALSVMWIIYGMTYIYGIVYMECWTTANLLSAIKHYSEMWSFMSVVQVYQANATLFFISGFLCIHMWYRYWNRNHKHVSFLMVIKWIFARYMSFMPAMMGMVMIYACLLRYITDGPLQPRDISDSVNCRENWWITMLLFHNVFRVHNQCFAWTWMYAAVWQLNLASLFILIPLVIIPIVGYVMIGLMYIAYLVIFVIWNQRNYDGENSWYFDVLQTPWCNAGPYCIGMMLAIIIHKARGKRQHMAWPVVLVLWICAMILIGAVVYAPWDYIKPDASDWSRAGHVAFDTMAPQMMALGVAWLSWSSHNGYAGVIGNLLNWKFFTVLSKLALPVTMFMGPAMVGHLYSRVQIFYVYDSEMSYLYYGQLIGVFIYAMFVALFFQHPVGRGIMIQILAVTRLELLLHSRHPDILDQLTGDPEQDEEFWTELDEKERIEQTRSSATTRFSVPNGKPVVGFLPCHEYINIPRPSLYPSLPDNTEYESLKKSSVAPNQISLQSCVDKQEKNIESTAF